MESAGKQPANANRSGSAATAEWTALRGPLRECGEIACQRLSSALSDALTQAADQLFIQGIQALTRSEREAWLDAADFARVRRQGLVYDFARHFEQRYVRACQRKPSLMTSYLIDFDISELRIVEHDLLDDALDPGMITEAIRNASGGSLYALARTFGRLLDGQEFKPDDIPLAPKLIEAAVSDAVRDQPWRHEAKLRLVRSLRKYLVKQVSLLYQDLVAHWNSGDTAALMANGEEADAFAPLDGETEDGLFAFDPMPAMANTGTGPESVPADETVAPALAETSEAPDQGKVDAPTYSPPAPAKPSPLAAVAGRSEIQATAAAMPPETAVPPGPELPAALLASLESGTWMAFREQDGSIRELKLAWISPRRSLFLLTDRHGARARSLSAEDLATVLRQERARLIPPPREASSPDWVKPGQHHKKSA